MKVVRRAYPNLTSPERKRLWSKIEKRGPDECWASKLKARGPKGRIKIRIHGDLWNMMQLIWEEDHDPPEPGEFVYATCFNNACCNPAHLDIAEQEDIARQKGTRAFGESVGTAKLTWSDVDQIRHLSKVGMHLADLARLFDVDGGTIRMAVEHKTWIERPVETIEQTLGQEIADGPITWESYGLVHDLEDEDVRLRVDR